MKKLLCLLLFISSIAYGQTGKTTLQETERNRTSLTGGEYFRIATTGANWKLDIDSLLDYMRDSIGSGSASASGPANAIQYRSGSSLAGSNYARYNPNDSLFLGDTTHTMGMLRAGRDGVAFIGDYYNDSTYVRVSPGKVRIRANKGSLKEISLEAQGGTYVTEFAGAGNRAVYADNDGRLNVTDALVSGYGLSTFNSITSAGTVSVDTSASKIATQYYVNNTDSVGTLVSGSIGAGFTAIDTARTNAVSNVTVGSGLTVTTLGKTKKITPSIKRLVFSMSDAGTAVIDSVWLNELVGTPSISDVGTGAYSISLTGAFPAYKTLQFTAVHYSGSMLLIRGERQNDNTYDLTAYRVADQSALDDDISGLVVEIKVIQ